MDGYVCTGGAGDAADYGDESDRYGAAEFRPDELDTAGNGFRNKYSILFQNQTTMTKRNKVLLSGGISLAGIASLVTIIGGCVSMRPQVVKMLGVPEAVDTANQKVDDLSKRVEGVQRDVRAIREILTRNRIASSQPITQQEPTHARLAKDEENQQ